MANVGQTFYGTFSRKIATFGILGATVMDFSGSQALAGGANGFSRSTQAAPTLNQTMPEGKSLFAGIRFLKVVIPGILYRGAGSGGKHPLSEAQLKALCEAGFSEAYYVYPDGFSSGQPITCTNSRGKSQQLLYSVQEFRPRDGRHRTLKRIFDIIRNPALGPAFVHCWNGWHASGEVAALALMQFCGWSGKEAGDYWATNIGDTGNLAKYSSIRYKHVGEFQPFDDLRLDKDTQDRICLPH